MLVDCKEVLNYLIGDDCWEVLGNIGDTMMDCLPFYDVFSNKISLIPKTLLRLGVGSNGMCAGNTAEEALIQGFCEVFERHFMIKLFSGEVDHVPVIPHSLCNENLQNCFAELKQRGFEVYAKDCSLNGKIPTAGLLIVKNNKAGFCIGSAPNFNIALERCFTELFQGMDFDLLERLKMKPIVSLSTCFERRNFTSREKIEKHNYLKTLRSGSGVVHPILFDNETLCNEKHLPLHTNMHSRKTLYAMVAPIRSAGYKAFVRNVGYLGFPAYQVYVPGMSEMLTIDHERLMLYVRDLPKAQKTFRGLGYESKENLAHLSETLEKLIDSPYVEREGIIQHLSTQCLLSTAILSNTEPEILLALIYYKTGKYSKATEIYTAYVRSRIGTDFLHNPPEYAKCHLAMLSILSSREKGFSEDDSIKFAAEKYGTEIADEIGQVFRSPENIGDFFGIAKCINCVDCNLADECLTKDLAFITEHLSKKFNDANLNQSELSKIWEGYEVKN
jgi:ribosomal protein S12 methylthiotransferase accessory factor